MHIPRGLPILILLCGLCLPAGTIQAQGDPIADAIRQKLEGVQIKSDFSVGACQISSLPVMAQVYKRRDYRPIWTRPEAVRQLIAAIQAVYLEGLNPQDYYLDEIQDLAKNNKLGPVFEPEMAASRDVLFTEAFIRLAHHISCGKEDPLTYHPQWNLSRAIEGIDPVEVIEKGIDAPSVTEAVDAWKVHHPYYELLKSALAEYRAIRAAGGWGSVPQDTIMKPGMKGPQVLALRKRLAAENLQLAAAIDPQFFDSGLQEALRRFQARYHLKQDGSVGPETLRALNIPVDDRIDQIRVNLERGRWVLGDLDDTYVLVDIAGFRVYFQKDHKIIWSSRAQVGKPYRDTPVFKSRITYMEFNPTWTVPPTVLEKDILPALKKDPRYLSKKKLLVIDNNGRQINPSSINWSLYPGKPFPYMLRQDPGPDNPLGRIKIMFPNPYLVYLHGTPSMALFEQEERAFSSGCIRVERPFELAELLLDNKVQWDIPQFQKIIDSGKTQRINLRQPMPILLMYWTVEIGDPGVFFKKDPYIRDPAMLEGLGRDADIRPGGV